MQWQTSWLKCYPERLGGLVWAQPNRRPTLGRRKHCLVVMRRLALGRSWRGGVGKAAADAKGCGKQIDGTRVEGPRDLYLQVIREWPRQQRTRRTVPAAPGKGRRAEAQKGRRAEGHELSTRVCPRSALEPSRVGKGRRRARQRGGLIT